MLEGSKDFAKEFMSKYNIPTAQSKSFTKESISEAINYLKNKKGPYVLKADGPAAGMSVAERTVCRFLGVYCAQVVCIEWWLQEGFRLSCLLAAAVAAWVFVIRQHRAKRPRPHL